MQRVYYGTVFIEQKAGEPVMMRNPKYNLTFTNPQPSASVNYGIALWSRRPGNLTFLLEFLDQMVVHSFSIKKKERGPY